MTEWREVWLFLIKYSLCDTLTGTIYAVTTILDPILPSHLLQL